MRRSRRFTTTAATIIWALSLSCICDAETIYVDLNVQSPGDGRDAWSNAYRYVQDALDDDQLEDGDEIWVAAGSYYADVGGDQTNNARSSTFALAAGVTLLGGFAGDETLRIERDPAANVTVLSGDLEQDDGPDFEDIDDNSYVVVTSDQVDEPTFIDGFTIRDGHHDDGGPGECEGGTCYGGAGMVIEPGVATWVVRCVFTDNLATDGTDDRYGGGLWIGTAIGAASRATASRTRSTSTGTRRRTT